MFFARVRWVGRVLDGAGIDTSSKTGRELSTALLKFSKYCQEKNRRRGEGACGVRLDLGPAEWAVLGAIFASEDPRVAEHIAEVLALSESDAAAFSGANEKFCDQTGRARSTQSCYQPCLSGVHEKMGSYAAETRQLSPDR